MAWFLFGGMLVFAWWANRSFRRSRVVSGTIAVLACVLLAGGIVSVQLVQHTQRKAELAVLADPDSGIPAAQAYDGRDDQAESLGHRSGQSREPAAP